MKFRADPLLRLEATRAYLPTSGIHDPDLPRPLNVDRRLPSRRRVRSLGVGTKGWVLIARSGVAHADAAATMAPRVGGKFGDQVGQGGGAASTGPVKTTLTNSAHFPCCAAQRQLRLHFPGVRLSQIEKQKNFRKGPSIMDDSKADTRIVGPKAELTKMFGAVAANDVFAICVDASDPAYPTGAAAIFSGENGTYSQACRPFDAAKLAAFATMLAAAHEALRLACIIRGRKGREIYCLHPDRSQPGAPSALDIEEARRHPGFLAEDGGFATLTFPRGEDRSDPMFAIYAAEGDGEAKRLWLGSVFWLNWIESLALTACKGHGDGGALIASGYGKRVAA